MQDAIAEAPPESGRGPRKAGSGGADWPSGGAAPAGRSNGASSRRPRGAPSGTGPLGRAIAAAGSGAAGGSLGTIAGADVDGGTASERARRRPSRSSGSAAVAGASRPDRTGSVGHVGPIDDEVGCRGAGGSSAATPAAPGRPGDRESSAAAPRGGRDHRFQPWARTGPDRRRSMIPRSGASDRRPAQPSTTYSSRGASLRTMRAVRAADDDVLDPGPVTSRPGRSRARPRRPSRPQRLVVAGDDVRLLVALEADAVPGPVEERLAVALGLDRPARGRIDRLGRDPRPDRRRRRRLRALQDGEQVPEPLVGTVRRVAAGDPQRAGDVRSRSRRCVPPMSSTIGSPAR